VADDGERMNPPGKCAFARIPEDDEHQGDKDQRRGLVNTAHVTPDVDRAGRSPLHYAALEGRVVDVAAYLHGHGGEVNLADEDGYTPLHFAAQQQHADVAAVLIEAGADLNARNRFGNTALWGRCSTCAAGTARLCVSFWTLVLILTRRVTTVSAPEVLHPRRPTATSCGSSEPDASVSWPCLPHARRRQKPRILSSSQTTRKQALIRKTAVRPPA
jgi:Ankyrin repeats (3 copies)